MATPTNLPAAQITGNVLTAAYMNDLRGAFRVLQVVNATSATETASSTGTYADTTLTATITPQSTSSKILVLVSQNGIFKSGNTGVNLRLLRGATAISTFAVNAGLTSTTADNNIGGISLCYLDSPSTTSATTYKTQLFSSSGIAVAIVQYASTMSTITLMEISA